jgi:hypothetical protein
MGSFGQWDQFFYGILGLFGLSKVCQAKCVSVNGIIRLMESVCLDPKVIPLSGTHTVVNTLNGIIVNVSIQLMGSN